MHLKLVQPAGTKRVDAGIGPHIAARSTVLSEFEGIEVRSLAAFVDEYQFVLAAIKAALSWRGLGPNANILQLVVDSRKKGAAE